MNGFGNENGFVLPAYGMPSYNGGVQNGMQGWGMQQPSFLNSGTPDQSIASANSTFNFGTGNPSSAPANSAFNFGDLFKKGGTFEGMLPSTTQDASGAWIKDGGYGIPLAGAASGLLSAFMGMKQYGLAKDSLAEGKRQFGLNYDAQRTTTNTQLQDRQQARVASNPGAYQSVSDYMSANSIKGR